ncbi:MAG: hypothetical protein ACO1N9_14270 [Flavobacterium sp.]
MKHLKLFLTVLAVAVSFAGTAQKVKLKKDVLFIDGSEYAILKQDKVSKFSYTLSNLKGEDLFYIKFQQFEDAYNGSTAYYEVLSANLEKIYFEDHLKACLGGCNHAEFVIKSLYNGEVISKDGKIDEQKLAILSKKLGFNYSRKRSEQN